MTELRCLGLNNVEDLLSYADEEGYLEMCNQPAHALGVLHFAEYCQDRRLYVEAFTHCTGMFDELYIVPEYQASDLQVISVSLDYKLTSPVGYHFCNSKAASSSKS